MSLVTRCPACGTSFRATRTQLAARGGQVRCGKCATVFNGIAALLEEGGEGFALEPTPQLGLFDPGRRQQAGESARASRSTPDGEPPAFLAEEPAQRAGGLWWGLLALLAAAALAAQIVYRYRSEIAAYVPAAGAPFAAACRFLDCELRLPRRPELLAIESSDLQADPRRDSVIVLNAVLRNRAPFVQEFPALELTLTDQNDGAVLRRVLAPQDYLDAPRGVQGLAAGSEFALRVYFDAGRTRATGYRLYLFYP